MTLLIKLLQRAGPNKTYKIKSTMLTHFRLCLESVLSTCFVNQNSVLVYQNGEVRQGLYLILYLFIHTNRSQRSGRYHMIVIYSSL